MVGDSIRDIHFAADSGGIFLGVCDTGVDSRQSLIDEMKELGNDLDSNSQVFSSIADPALQNILHTECEAYLEALKHLSVESWNVVEAAGIEPASANSLPLVLHA